MPGKYILGPNGEYIGMETARGAPAPFSGPSGSYNQALMQPYWERVNQGLPSGYMSTMAQLESSGGQDLTNSRGYTGPFQFGRGAAQDVLRANNLSFAHDPYGAAAMAAAYGLQNQAAYKQRFGVDPSGFELYLMHNQGGQGASNIFSQDPSQKIRDLENETIANNIITQGFKLNDRTINRDNTVGDFLQAVAGKYAGFSPFKNQSPNDIVGQLHSREFYQPGTGAAWDDVIRIMPRAAPNGQQGDFPAGRQMASADIASALYRQQNPQIGNEDPWDHYQKFGQAEGKGWYGATPWAGSGSNFDPGKLYLQQNPEVAARGEDPWTHFTKFGLNEGNTWAGAAPQTNYGFDAGELYLRQNPEVAARGEDPWQHYTQFGQKEGKDWYGAAPSATTLNGFDTGQLYLEQNPDVARQGLDPWQHFTKFGQQEGRQWAGPAAALNSPEGGFNPGLFYQQLYPDVEQQGLDPWSHFVKFGANEGRQWAGPQARDTEGRLADWGQVPGTSPGDLGGGGGGSWRPVGEGNFGMFGMAPSGAPWSRDIHTMGGHQGWLNAFNRMVQTNQRAQEESARTRAETDASIAANAARGNAMNPSAGPSTTGWIPPANTPDFNDPTAMGDWQRSFWNTR